MLFVSLYSIHIIYLSRTSLIGYYMSICTLSLASNLNSLSLSKFNIIVVLCCGVADEIAATCCFDQIFMR